MRADVSLSVPTAGGRTGSTGDGEGMQASSSGSCLLRLHGLAILSPSECLDDGLVASTLNVLGLKAQEAGVERLLVSRHPILTRARRHARTELASCKVIISKAHEAERSCQHLDSFSGLGLGPVALPRVVASVRIQCPVVNPHRQTRLNHDNGNVSFLGSRVLLHFLMDRQV